MQTTELLLRGFPFFPLALKWRFGPLILRMVRAEAKMLRPRVVRCTDGFRMLIDPLDWLGSHVGLWREYESGLTSLLRRLVKRGDHFIDIGANIGYFSLLAASIVDVGGTVSVVEPSPLIRKDLVRNILLNNFGGRITVYDVAAWNETGEKCFYQGPAEHTGISTLRTLPEATSKFIVKTEPIDRLIPFEINPVTFVKIDVEGAEYQVLLGMTKLLDGCRPFVAVELTDRFLKAFGDSAGDVLRLLLTERNYHVYNYDYKGTLVHACVDEILRDTHQQYNLLFSPRTL